MLLDIIFWGVVLYLVLGALDCLLGLWWDGVRDYWKTFSLREEWEAFKTVKWTWR